MEEQAGQRPPTNDAYESPGKEKGTSGEKQSRGRCDALPYEKEATAGHAQKGRY